MALASSWHSSPRLSLCGYGASVQRLRAVAEDRASELDPGLLGSPSNRPAGASSTRFPRSCCPRLRDLKTGLLGGLFSSP